MLKQYIKLSFCFYILLLLSSCYTLDNVGKEAIEGIDSSVVKLNAIQTDVDNALVTISEHEDAGRLTEAILVCRQELAKVRVSTEEISVELTQTKDEVTTLSTTITKYETDYFLIPRLVGWIGIVVFAIFTIALIIIAVVSLVRKR